MMAGGCSLTRGGSALKQAIVAIVLLGTASVLAHLYVVAQTYYPVVRVASPEGLVFTAVHDATSERSSCATANSDFLAPFKSMCPECKVVAARCERELDGFESSLMSGKALPHPLVSAPGFHMAITGPDEVAQSACDHIARSASAGEVRCLAPRKPFKS